MLSPDGRTVLTISRWIRKGTGQGPKAICQPCPAGNTAARRIPILRTRLAKGVRQALQDASQSVRNAMISNESFHLGEGLGAWISPFAKAVSTIFV